MRFRPVLLVLALAGCAHRPIVPPASTPEPNAGVEGRGEVAYRFLLDPSAWQVTRSEGTEFVAPNPVSAFPAPAYPPAALAAHVGAAHVVVRIVIDTTGRISDVKDSPVESSSLGPFAREFRDAVLRSLRHWRFAPGHIARLEKQTGGEGGARADYREVASIDLVPVYYDVRFDFEIVGGEGRVRRNMDPR